MICAMRPLNTRNISSYAHFTEEMHNLTKGMQQHMAGMKKDLPKTAVIDYIIPLYVAKDVSELKKLMHYENTQLLTLKDSKAKNG